MTGINVVSVPIVWVLVPLLVAVILYDLRFMRLPNVLSLLFLVVFLGTLPGLMTSPDPWGALAWPVGTAAVVLVTGMLANALGLMGGGDVKILAALMLFIPTDQLVTFVTLLCFCMVIGIFGMMALRSLRAGRPSRWKSLTETKRYPMGLSIGAAALLLIALG